MRSPRLTTLSALILTVMLIVSAAPGHAAPAAAAAAPAFERGSTAGETDPTTASETNTGAADSEGAEWQLLVVT